MFEQFSAYLDLIATPERKKVYLDACHSLHQIGLAEHGFQIDQQISLAEDADTEIFLHSVDGILQGALMEVLGEHGVTVSHDASIAQLTDILNGLQLIENYDDSDTIYAYAEAPEGAEAALADILQLMGAYDSSVYLTLLSEVNPALLDRIQQLHSRETPELLPDALQVDHARSRVTKFLATYTVTLLPEALAEQQRLAIPLDDMVEPYRDRLDEMDADSAVRELIAFALASDVEDGQLRAEISKEAELLFADHKKLTLMDIASTRILKELGYA